MPLTHVGGLSIPIRSAIYATTVVAARALRHRGRAGRADRPRRGGSRSYRSCRRCSRGCSTPACERPPTLRWALLGGGPIAPALLERARPAGVPVAPTYGMTEACSQIATFGCRCPASRCGPTAGARSSCAARSSSAGAVDRDGWLHTGDLGAFDERGRLTIVGRKADTIVTGGENVAPDRGRGGAAGASRRRRRRRPSRGPTTSGGRSSSPRSSRATARARRRRRSCARSARHGSPATRCRSRSSSSTRCRAPDRASCCDASCADRGADVTSVTSHQALSSAVSWRRVRRADDRAAGRRVGHDRAQHPGPPGAWADRPARGADARVGYYGPEHLAALRLIRELQHDGFNLAAIKRLLDDRQGTAERLQRSRGAQRPAATEHGETLTPRARQRFRVGANEAPEVLAEAERLGVLVPAGDGRFRAPSPSLLAVAERSSHAGSRSSALSMFEEIDRHCDAVSQRSSSSSFTRSGSRSAGRHAGGALAGDRRLGRAAAATSVRGAARDLPAADERGYRGGVREIARRVSERTPRRRGLVGYPT